MRGRICVDGMCREGCGWKLGFDGEVCRWLYSFCILLLNLHKIYEDSWRCREVPQQKAKVISHFLLGLPIYFEV